MASSRSLHRNSSEWNREMVQFKWKSNNWGYEQCNVGTIVTLPSFLRWLTSPLHSGAYQFLFLPFFQIVLSIDESPFFSYTVMIDPKLTEQTPIRTKKVYSEFESIEMKLHFPEPVPNKIADIFFGLFHVFSSHKDCFWAVISPILSAGDMCLFQFDGISSNLQKL